MQLRGLRNRNREIEMKGPFMVHWHAPVFLLHSMADSGYCYCGGHRLNYSTPVLVNLTQSGIRYHYVFLVTFAITLTTFDSFVSSNISIFAERTIEIDHLI